MNTAQNDAVTNYYSIYGSTPRAVVQGTVIPSSTRLSTASIFSSNNLGTTSFDIKTTSWRTQNNDSIEVISIIKKVAVSSLTTAKIYGLISEDTLRYAAQNGEQLHYNVFRKSLASNIPTNITLPTNEGDSIVLRYKISSQPTWGNTSATLILSDAATKSVLQANRTRVLASMPTSVSEKSTLKRFIFYPNPSTSEFTIQAIGFTEFSINNSVGQLVLKGNFSDKIQVKTTGWAKGIYLIHLNGYATEKIIVQ